MSLQLQQKNNIIYISADEDNNQEDLMKEIDNLLNSEFTQAVFNLHTMSLSTKRAVGQYLMYFRNTSESGRDFKVQGIQDGQLIISREVHAVRRLGKMAN